MAQFHTAPRHAEATERDKSFISEQAVILQHALEVSSPPWDISPDERLEKDSVVHLPLVGEAEDWQTEETSILRFLFENDLYKLKQSLFTQAFRLRVSFNPRPY